MATRLLDIKQVAERLGVPASTIHGWRSRKLPCPPAVRLGRSLKWREDDVDAWVDAQFAQFDQSA